MNKEYQILPISNTTNVKSGRLTHWILDIWHLKFDIPRFGGAGFTLIEILVAIVIIMLVFGFVFTSASAIQKKTRDQQRMTDLQNLQSALAAYYADQQFFPTAEFSIGTSTVLNNDIGNPQISTPTKTYNVNLPKDPTSTPNYCYKPQVNFSDSSNCDNASSITACQYYFLCAQLEGGTASTPNCTTGCSTFNYKLTPASSSD